MSGKPNYTGRVGLMVVGAVCMVNVGINWLHGESLWHRLKPPQRFIVQFHDVAGLNNNAPVNINGVRVGTVEKIELSTNGAPPKQGEPPKEAGVVFAHLKITQDGVTIPVGSTITIQTLGLVGAKYIEISLPELKAGQPPAEDIKTDAVIVGQDPVRIELVMNKIATKLNSVVNAAGSDDVGPSLADALRHSGEAVNNINEAAKKLNKNMDGIEKASTTFTATAQKIGQLAEGARNVTSGANSFFAKGNKAMDQINVLATDFQGTSHRLNKILDNPALSSDLKETVSKAKATADKIAETVDKINATVKDPSVRGDLVTITTKINNTMDRMETSLGTVDKISSDKDLRELIAKFSDSLAKFDSILGSSDLQGDTKSTFARVRDAADNVNQAAEQMQNVLDKPGFMGKMIFGSKGEKKYLKRKLKQVPQPDKSLVEIKTDTGR